MLFLEDQHNVFGGLQVLTFEAVKHGLASCPNYDITYTSLPAKAAVPKNTGSKIVKRIFREKGDMQRSAFQCAKGHVKDFAGSALFYHLTFIAV